MKEIYVHELKVGDVLINVGKVNKITHSTMPIDWKTSRSYYHIYGEDCIYPITYEANKEVYIEVSK